MAEAVPAPTRLERVVGVLAKAALALWVGGVALLMVNSFLIHTHRLYLIALGAIRAGFLVALVIVVSVVGTTIVGRIRGKSKPPA